MREKKPVDSRCSTSIPASFMAIWMYTLVFAFSSLWFAHYCLLALEQLRHKNDTFVQAAFKQDKRDLIMSDSSLNPFPVPNPDSPPALR